jgi:hypothetical protein
MSFIHDKTATVTFIGDHYTISTVIDVPADTPRDNLDAETESIIVEKASAFIKEYYGWDLGDTWFDYSIELSDYYPTD